MLKTIAPLEASAIITSVAITPGYQELEAEREHYITFVKRLQAQYPTLSVSFSFELIPRREITVTREPNDSYRKSVNAIDTAFERDYLAENFYRDLSERQQVRNCGYGGITLTSNGDLYWCWGRADHCNVEGSHDTYRCRSHTAMQELRHQVHLWGWVQIEPYPRHPSRG